MRQGEYTGGGGDGWGGKDNEFRGVRGGLGKGRGDGGRSLRRRRRFGGCACFHSSGVCDCGK